MVAASPLLTTNALARMLEERPDPSAFQPVLQIAGNCFVYVFYYETMLLLSLFFFFERIDSFFARERSNFWIHKRIVRDSIFDVSPLFFSVYLHIVSLFLYHAQTSARLRAPPENRNRRRTRDTGSWSGMFFVWKSSHLKSGHFLNFFSFTPSSLRSSRAAWETILLRLLLLL